jgi:hypothetical protein
MKHAMIPWEIRGRRLVDGALCDQHVAVGFGPTAKAAIAWARRHEPAKMSSFPDSDLRAIPDPLPVGLSSLPAPFAVACAIVTACVLLAGVCAADGGQSISVGFSCAPLEKGMGFESLRRKTAGPAESISTVSRESVGHGSGSKPTTHADLLGCVVIESAGAGEVDLQAGVRPVENYVHPSSGFSGPASGLAWGDGVGNGNTRVFDTARPQPIAGGGFNFRGLFALGIVTASAFAGLMAIASCAISGRLSDPR